MIADPWSLHSSLSCPACHVTGKVIRFEREDGGYDCCDDEHVDDIDPYVCVECGQSFVDVGVMADVKDYRVHYMRLVEGMPYEPPKPVVSRWDQQEQKPLDMTVFDEMLKKIYAAGPPPNAAIIGGGLVRIVPDPNMPPNSFVLVTDLKTEAPSQSGSYALSADTWTFAPCEHCGEAFKPGHPFACKA